MSLSQNSVALAAAALLASGGCDLRCNGPTTILPVNIHYGGRAIAIATNPQDDKAALVVSESGGIFQTRNSGSPWFQITGTTTFWFSDVHYYDANPEILIATAFRDMKVANSGGVWRSTSGGAAWTHVAITPPDLTKPFEAYGIAVEPSTPPRIWVGTSQGLISSTDEGVTWTFQPPLSNFPQDKVFCVLAPSPNHLRVITKQGFRASDDGGATWIQPTGGQLPLTNGLIPPTHNQLACSPANDEVIYWCGYAGDDSGGISIIVTRSMDGGLTWETVTTRDTNNRPPFIRTTPRALSSPDKYQLYFSDGQRFTGRVDVNKSDEQIGDWHLMPSEHADNSDIGFKTDGFTPWLLAGDGGLQKSSDQGASWKMAGNGADGYLALQISDATGQPHAWDRQSDLYFGTQDNDFWASGNDGRDWPRSTPTEGMHLEVSDTPRPAVHGGGSERPHPRPVKDHVTFINSPAPAKEQIAAPLLANAVLMNLPQKAVLPVRRLADEIYMTSLPPPDMTVSDEMWISYNHGSLWLDRCQSPGYAYEVDRTKIVNGSGGPILFYADYIQSANGLEIMRAYDLLGAGTPVFSSITGFGTLGTADVDAQGGNVVWDMLYAVDPFDPDHILLVDGRAGVIRFTWDGGATWTADNNLKAAITHRGTYQFQIDPPYGRTQITTIAFDPRQRGRILVGTVQAGVFFSCTFGHTWMRQPDSENIPNVSSFYFTPEGWVLASSYGRGLWSLELTCPAPNYPPPSIERRTSGPIFETGGATFPLSTLIAEPKFSFLVARGGDITGYQTDKTGKLVASIGVTSGAVEGLTMSGEKVPPTVPARNVAAHAPSDPKLAELMKEGFRIKAICLEGQVFKGYVLSKTEITATDLPKPRLPGPTIRVTLTGNERREVATIQGVRFEPGKALQVLVNDQVLPAAATAGRNGGFEFGVPVPPMPGHYVLTVRQNGAHGPASASAYYDITPSD